MSSKKFSYSLTINGGEIDARNAQRLVSGDSLILTRLQDELDTFEIVVSTPDGKELDMLPYLESVGIAPFIDDKSLKVAAATVTGVKLIRGKTHSVDSTTVAFDISFEYDDTLLREFCSGSGIFGFLPLEDNFYSLCLFRCLDYSLPIISQTHLNRYEFEVDIDEDSKEFFDIDFKDGDYFYRAEALFNESFSQCKMRCKVYDQQQEYPLELQEKDCEKFLCLINHHRILNDQDPIGNCEIIL